jgi:hypothetical protein
MGQAFGAYMAFINQVDYPGNLPVNGSVEVDHFLPPEGGDFACITRTSACLNKPVKLFEGFLSFGYYPEALAVLFKLDPLFP